MNEIKIIIKSSNTDKNEIFSDPTLTVSEFKEKIFETLPIEPALQRLIYKGRVSKDGCSLVFYQIEDGQTIHLVKGGGGLDYIYTIDTCCCSCPLHFILE